ncbi:MAG: FHA domain-containing protein [Desulfobacterales bacterium]|jgi:pSer/pThr/pTyr-binding forkhead associated (FHA) protein|nr:FHA domain-containing protein [Desulfobacterales bacterium]MCK5417055.1 FHA domain-containing protein [Desulfobacterales bacterium]MCK5485584.1 FHA domain-containing protein [Desulfobacterales bacterium]
MNPRKVLQQIAKSDKIKHPINQEVGIMLKIELKFKDRVLKHFETDKSEITIGRGTNNDIQIDNLAVSKTHAKIIRHPDHYTVVDLKSTNGTLLNNKQITKANLNPNDIVTIGKHTLQINLMDETQAPVQDLADKTVKVSG